MLTHENLLWNAWYASQCADFGPHEIFLSFLPMSHTLERTGGYYLPMLIGAEVAYARSIAQLAKDLQEIHPTVLVSVPRIYERVYGRIQDGWRRKAAARMLFTLAVRVAGGVSSAPGAGWHPELLLWLLLTSWWRHRHERLGGRLKLAISGGAALPRYRSRVYRSGVPIYQG
jgi:long-chain acyl-CoA synthetase